MISRVTFIHSSGLLESWMGLPMTRTPTKLTWPSLPVFPALFCVRWSIYSTHLWSGLPVWPESPFITFAAAPVIITFETARVDGSFSSSSADNSASAVFTHHFPPPFKYNKQSARNCDSASYAKSVVVFKVHLRIIGKFRGSISTVWLKWSGSWNQLVNHLRQRNIFRNNCSWVNKLLRHSAAVAEGMLMQNEWYLRGIHLQMFPQFLFFVSKSP